MLKKLESFFWCGVGLFILTGIVVFSFSGNVCIDTAFHLMRLDALTAWFSEGGSYPCRFYADVCNGSGYASPQFYCDLFLAPFAWLRVWGMPRAMAFEWMLLTVALLPFVTMFVTMRTICGRSKKSLLCAVIYGVSPSFIAQFFSAGQVGAATAYAFVPLALLPTVALLTENEMSQRRKVGMCALIVVGMCGMVGSHVITTILVGLAMVIFCLCRTLFLLRHPARIVVFALAAAATAGMMAWFWMPMIEQMLAGELFVEAGGTAYDLVETATTSLGFFLPWIFCVKIAQWTGTAFPTFDTFNSYGFFLVPLMFLVVYDCFKRRFSKPSTYTICLLSGACFFFILFWSRPLIQLLNPWFGWVQFMWRFVPLFVCLLAPLVAEYMWQIRSRWRVFLFLAFTLCVALVFFNPGWVLFQRLSSQYSFEIVRTLSPATARLPIGLGEYLPRKAGIGIISQKHWKSEYPPRLLWVGQPAMPEPYTEEAHVLTAQVADESGEAQCPFFYYKGYSATVDGVYCPVEEGMSGQLLVKLPKRGGTLKVWYEGTWIQRISVWISIGSLALLAILGVSFLWWRKRK